MPSSSSLNNKKYNLVTSDELDTRVPIMPEEAFDQGIPFHCKFIGSMSIPRPTTRVEIVAAMRRVRFEYKQKGNKKKKVTLTVSMDGIKTTLRKRRSRKKRIVGRGNKYVDVENSMLILSHPIYRIFYVSHDSQDVKIFSYIARETSSNLFHCAVFKANKKAQALRIVRTVGQAFEVCHKLVAPSHENVENIVDDDNNLLSEIKKEEPKKKPNFFKSITSNQHEKNKAVTAVGVAAETGGGQDVIVKPVRPVDLDLHLDKENEVDLVNFQSPESPVAVKERTPESPVKSGKCFQNSNIKEDVFEGSTRSINKMQPTEISKSSQNLQNMSNLHETQLLREKLDQQLQQTQAALAQVNLLRDQLNAEANARIEAQARTHQLLLHNKELLDHLQSLVRHIQELEGNHGQQVQQQQIPQSILPQVFQQHVIPTSTGPSLHNLYNPFQTQLSYQPPPPPSSPLISSFQEIESLRRQNTSLLDTILYEQNALRNLGSGGYFSNNSTNSNSPSQSDVSRSINFYPYPSLNQQPMVFGNPMLHTHNHLNYQDQHHHQNQNQNQRQDTATIFTSKGDPLGYDQPDPIIKPLNLLSPPGQSTPKLGQIGRTASDNNSYEEENALSRKQQQILGRSVSEKMNRKTTELISIAQRQAWARHTTK